MANILRLQIGILLVKCVVISNIIYRILNNSHTFNREYKCNKRDINTLLAFKDRLSITDADWPYVCEVFELGPESSIHYVRKQRQVVNKTINPTQVITKKH